MKATGIVRRIDDLGRVVIPEIRRTLRIRRRPLRFLSTARRSNSQEYSPIGSWGLCQGICRPLHEAIGHIALIADRDNIIAVAGAPKKEFLNKAIGPGVEKTLEERKVAVINDLKEHPHCKQCPVNEAEGGCKVTAEVIAPIISQGDPIGAVIIMSKDAGVKMGELEVKLAETAAGFLAKQMEQ